MGWKPIGREENIAAGNMQCVVIEDEPIAVYHLEKGWFATSDICTHQECSLSERKIEGDEVICLCHGGAFDIRSGATTRMPCVISVETFRMRVRDGIVEVDCE